MLPKFSSELGTLRDSLERGDPGFLQTLEDGLGSRDRDRWLAIAESLKGCNGGWRPLLLKLIPAEPEAICWLIAAGKHEFWMSGANSEKCLAADLSAIPDIHQLLGRLDSISDPWVRKMAQEARRLLK